MNGKKLLVADDSLTIQKVIRLALSNEGYEIQAASEGDDALQQIAVFRPDVVLVDISLPGKNAFELKQAVNDFDDPNPAKFILMSSAFEAVDEDEQRRVGFDGRLIKPFDPANLRGVLSGVLKGPSRPPGLPPAPPSKPAAKPMDKPTDTGLSEFSSSFFPPKSEDLPFPQVPEFPKLGGQPADPPTNPAMDYSDIRNLTESTIRLSGLEDFEWSVSETGKKSSPVPPPPPSAGPSLVPDDFPPGDFALDDLAPDTSTLDTSHIELSTDSPTPPAFGGYAAAPPFEFDSGLLETQAEDPVEPHSTEHEVEAPHPAYAHQPDPDVTSVTVAEMQEAMSRQMEETLTRMAERLLPELAEKILRQEIRRMLSEQPNS